jgi:dienelactone hydrolase
MQRIAATTTSRQRYLGVSLAVAILFFGAARAAAQEGVWLEPVDAGHPALGPGEANGAVIWSHGRSVDSEDCEARTPPYIAVLGDARWDAFRFNRRRAYDTLALSTRKLAAEVHRLKLKGYRQVALAGQSFGAFLSLMAADASDEVDAVIATAPAAYGSSTDFEQSWELNATKLYPLLQQLRHARVMLFYFQGDDFDPGGRGARSREILLARKLPFIVVDQPPGLTSHWAAGDRQFARVFGRCILGFIETPALGNDARCDDGTLVTGTVDAGLVQTQTAARPMAVARRR